MVLTRSLTSSGLASAGLERAFGLVNGELLPDVVDYFNGIEPYHYLDFTTNRALFAGVDRGAVGNTPGWSFTRASVGSAENAAGEIIRFVSGALRRTDKGVLIEGARTNLFLNSAVGATQSVTVAAAAHTLSFRGTGTITLTGVSTSGPLVGTGANNRVTLTFTPTAGSLTLTVSGSCTNVNLEAGAFASSWIETAGSSVLRASDALNITSPGVTYPLTLFAEFERAVDTGGAENLFNVSNGSNTDRAEISVTSADLANVFAASGNVTQASFGVTGALAISTPYKFAARFAANDVQGAKGGTLGAGDTGVTVPATPTIIRFGATPAGTVNAFGYIRRAAIFNSALSDANLQAITA